MAVESCLVAWGPLYAAIGYSAGLPMNDPSRCEAHVPELPEYHVTMPVFRLNVFVVAYLETELHATVRRASIRGSTRCIQQDGTPILKVGNLFAGELGSSVRE